MASTSDTQAALTSFLQSKGLPPSTTWMTNFMASVRPSTPVNTLQKTVLYRVLAADLTTTLSPPPSQLLPADVSSPQTKQRIVVGPVTVQLLDMEDVGRSRWSQLEQLEEQERGEMTKGREMIRVVADDSNEGEEGNQANLPSMGVTGPHKLLLQDAAGTTCYAFDPSPVPGINLRQLGLGTKLVLRKVSFARGVALLDDQNVEILGGKVEAWSKKWQEERKEVLKRTAEIGNGEE